MLSSPDSQNVMPSLALGGPAAAVNYKPVLRAGN
jgi:hypothetical protein